MRLRFFLVPLITFYVSYLGFNVFFLTVGTDRSLCRRYCRKSNGRAYEIVDLEPIALSFEYPPIIVNFGARSRTRTCTLEAPDPKSGASTISAIRAYLTGCFQRTLIGVPGPSRTVDPELRGLMLYPTELRAHVLNIIQCI